MQSCYGPIMHTVSSTYHKTEADNYDIVGMQIALAACGNPELAFEALSKSAFQCTMPEILKKFESGVTENDRIIEDSYKEDGRNQFAVVEFFNALTAVCSNQIGLTRVVDMIIRQTFLYTPDLFDSSEFFYGDYLRKTVFSVLVAVCPATIEEIDRILMKVVTRDANFKNSLIDEFCDVNEKTHLITLKKKFKEDLPNKVDFWALQSSSEVQSTLTEGWNRNIGAENLDQLRSFSMDNRLTFHCRELVCQRGFLRLEATLHWFQRVVSELDCWQSCLLPFLKLLSVFLDSLTEDFLASAKQQFEGFFGERLRFVLQEIDKRCRSHKLLQQVEARVNAVRVQIGGEEEQAESLMSLRRAESEVRKITTESQNLRNKFELKWRRLSGLLRAKRQRFLSGVESTAESFMENIHPHAEANQIFCVTSKKVLTASATYFRFAQTHWSNVALVHRSSLESSPSTRSKKPASCCGKKPRTPGCSKTSKKPSASRPSCSGASASCASRTAATARRSPSR